MKSMVLLLILLFANVSFASIRREFFVNHGSLLLTLDLPNKPYELSQPIIVQITDPATHQLLEVDYSSVEVIYWFNGDKNIQTTDEMDRCDKNIGGRYCSTLNFTHPGAWNINVTYKVFHGDQDAQTFMFEVK